MSDDWRIRITFGDVGQLGSGEQGLTRELSRRLGYAVKVSRRDSQILVCLQRRIG
jgi:hypothetical protein